MNSRRNVQLNLAVGVLALLAVRIEPAVALAGLADWEEEIEWPYYLVRGPGTGSPTRNVVSVVRKQGGSAHHVVEDVVQDRCHIHNGVIIGLTTEGKGFLIEIQSGEVLVASEADVKRRARSLGVPAHVGERVFGWRLRPKHLFLGLSLALAFSMLAMLILRKTRRRPNFASICSRENIPPG